MQIIDKLIENGWDQSNWQDSKQLDKVDFSENVSYPAEAYGHIGTENFGFWASHRSDEILRLLKKYNRSTMIEVGAGSGAVAIPLKNAGIEVMAIEPIHTGVEFMSANGVLAISAFFGQLKFPSSSVSTIGIFDVIEHIEQPDAVLAEIHRVLEPGGLLFITVPNGQWLWGSIDVTLGHFRRYSRKELNKTLLDNNFKLSEIGYLFLLLVPVAFLVRSLPYRFNPKSARTVSVTDIQHQLTLNSKISKIVRTIMKLELWASSKARLPYGLSIIAVYEKPKN